MMLSGLSAFQESLMAAAVGMGLSVCGTVMQAIIKNPLADPYVLGVSSGAYLGAAASIVIGIGSVLGAASMGIMAFAGAFAASIAVLAIAGIGGRFKVTSLTRDLVSECRLFCFCKLYYLYGSKQGSHNANLLLEYGQPGSCGLGQCPCYTDCHGSGYDHFWGSVPETQSHAAWRRDRHHPWQQLTPDANPGHAFICTYGRLCRMCPRV